MIRKLELLLPVVLFICASKVCATSRMEDSNGRETQFILEEKYTSLKSTFEICGRYPTTEEGLVSLVNRPSKFACPSGNVQNWPFVTSSNLKDGWGIPLVYESNGESYRLTASHHYFLTDTSPTTAIKKLHWENPEYVLTRYPPLDYQSWKRFYFFSAIFFLFSIGLIFRKSVALTLPKKVQPTFLRVSLVLGVVSVFLLLLNVWALLKGHG